MILWLSILVLAAIWTAVVVSVLLTARAGVESTSMYDAAVYEDQLDELDRDVKRDVIGAQEAAAARVEISRKLLAATERSRSEGGDFQTASTGKGRVWAGAVVGLFVPIISFFLYALSGSPGVPSQPYANDLGTWRQRAQSFLEVGDFKQAATAFEQAIAVSSRSPDLLVGRGIALVFDQGGEIGTESEAIFQEVLVSFPADATGLYFVGLAHAQRQELVEAAAHWRPALENASSDWPWYERAQRQLTLAENFIAAEQQQNQGPSGPTQEDIEAAADMDAGSRQQMIEGMVEGLASRLAEEPDDLDGWLQLARSYVVLGNAEAARHSIAQARTTFADDERAIGRILAAEAELGLED